MRANAFIRIVAVAGVIAVMAAVVAVRRVQLRERGHPVAPMRDGVSQRSAENRHSARSVNEQAQPEKNPSLVEAILGAVEKETDPAVREFIIEDFVASLQIFQISSAIVQLNGPSDFAREIKTQLIRKWAGADPNAAAGWVQNQSPTADRQLLVNAIATIWANQDLSAAMAWVRQLDGELRQGALLKVAYEAVDTDLNKALSLARELSGDVAQTDLVEHIAAEWATRQPKQIADWAMQIQDAVVRDRIAAGITASWAETEPEAAATFAISSIGPGKAQDDAIISVIQRWVQTKPAEAAAWVTQFPEGRLRDIAVVEIVKGWSQRNATDTARWVEGLSQGTIRELATHAFSEIKIAEPSADQIPE